MYGINKVSLATLLSPDNLTFEREYEGNDGSSIRQRIRQIQFISSHLRPFKVSALFALGIYDIAELRTDPKTNTLYVYVKEYLDVYYKQVYRNQNNYSKGYFNLIRNIFNGVNGSGDDNNLSHLAEDFKKSILKLCKVTKNRTTTLKNWIVGYATVLGIELTQAELKNILTKSKAESEKWYIYSTNNYYAQHYSELNKRERIVTCMTKSNFEYEHSAHYVKADIELAEKAGYPVNENGEVFTAPVECWNFNKGVRLFLVSKTPPQEIATQTDYPFVARAIVGEISGIKCFVRAYGNEKGLKVLSSLYKCANGYRDVQIRAYCVSSKELTEYDEYYILPYIDGAYNVWLLDKHKQVDELGRTYVNASLVEMHRDDEVKKAGISKSLWTSLYTCSQDNWVSKPIKFVANCDILKIEFPSSKLVYSAERDAFIYKELQDKDYSQRVLDTLSSVIDAYTKSDLHAERADYCFRRARRAENMLDNLLGSTNLVLGGYNFKSFLSPTDKKDYDGNLNYLTDVVWGIEGPLTNPVVFEELARCVIRLTFFNTYKHIRESFVLPDYITMMDVLKVWIEQDHIFSDTPINQIELSNVILDIKSNIARLERTTSYTKHKNVFIDDFFKNIYTPTYNTWLVRNS